MTNGTAPITVAIATYRRPPGLARAVDALLAGSTLPAEIVVVDQSEDDATAAVTAERAAAAPIPIRYIAQRAKGLSRSRNAGVAAATQDIVAVTDDDCVAHSQWVEVIARTITPSGGVDGIGGRVLPLGPDAAGLAAVSSRTSEQRRDYAGKVVPWVVGTGANFAVRKEWLVRVGGYDVRLGAGSRGGAGEDMDAFFRLLRAGAHLRYEPDAIIYHERQPIEQRARSRRSYGRGIGACCALWLREGDGFGGVALARWCEMRLGRLMRAVARRDTVTVREEVNVLRGTVAGVAYGFLVREPRSAQSAADDPVDGGAIGHSATSRG